MYCTAVGRVKVRYGWVEWIKTHLGFFLLVVLTLFLCGVGSNREWHIDFHLDEPNNEPIVTASSAFISISATPSIDNIASK